ncbi:hypothetical protein OIU76_029928, partial [Salix suchowensis]
MESGSYILVGLLHCPQKECKSQIPSWRRKFVLLFLVPVAILVQRLLANHPYFGITVMTA